MTGTKEDAGVIVVRLPAILVDLFPGSRRRVDMRAPTVRSMVDELERLWPGMRDRICDSTPAIRRHINIFINGNKVKLDAPIPPGAEVFILTAISGG